MQAEIQKQNIDARTQYLRISTISGIGRSNYFLYIGHNEHSIHNLSLTFTAGSVADRFDIAKKILAEDKFKREHLDVIVIDISYNKRALIDFYLFLREYDLADKIPLIYNCEHVKNADFRLPSVIDDVIDLNNCQYDFDKKIDFLKKAKQHSLPLVTSASGIQLNDSIYKRTFDFVIALIGLIVLLPIYILLAICIKLESKGPVFYKSKRAGKGFKVFDFYKFRTMEVNADEKIKSLAHLNQYQDNNQGAMFFKIKNDPRVTKVGRFLRNTSLDELPQLFNVLKGDMSIVGNRPLPLYEAATLTTNDYVERFMAPAGITGLWQIKKRGKSNMSTSERVNLDISYARRSNIIYDLWIVINTPGALFQKSDV